MKILYSSFIFMLLAHSATGNFINANSSNYNTFLNSLVAGDTLFLNPGNYLNNLTLNSINGTATKPIVIIGAGNTTILKGQSCCNTISITKCSFLVIKKMMLDGLNQNIDAVKGEGSAGNWAHHITIEYLEIRNYRSSQQNVGISTKCPAWDWIIRKNRIIGAGTGMYLGNSDGTKPFVNGIIEYNYISNTLGYNIEIKHQLDTVRDKVAGTAMDGKTILRYNVFTKDTGSASGGNARPNLLVGGFPLIGWGAKDYYEIYGNLFYNNPTEALFQGTGNIMIYNNIFVNHYDPLGYRAIYIAPQNGVNPQDIKIYHNTVWTQNSSGAIRLLNPKVGYRQYCVGNAVFSSFPITNFLDTLQNIVNTYGNASAYVLSASNNIASLNLYPKASQLIGLPIIDTVFQKNTSWNKDFNNDPFTWSYIGAYAGCCNNYGWQLQLDTMPTHLINLNFINPEPLSNVCQLFPNPVINFLYLEFHKNYEVDIEIFSSTCTSVFKDHIIGTKLNIDLIKLVPGIYFITIKGNDGIITKRIIKQ